MKKNISGWGRFPKVLTQFITPTHIEEILDLLKKGPVIARGNGRSYGDSACSQGITISMKNFNKIISFNENSGLVIAESGVLLSDINKTFIPKGWFPFVTPGTKFVTLGGLISSDTHGKNHHKDGSIQNFVEWFEIISSSGNILKCSASKNSELFYWTLGGMGLTGIITKVAFKLRPIKTAWIKQKIIPTKNLAETIETLNNTIDSTYSVAWIDCLKTDRDIGRSLVILGEHANFDDLDKKRKKFPLHIPSKFKFSIPFELPSWLLNRFILKIFNLLYYWNGKRKKKIELVDWDSYFYPLDKIKKWNKIYGKKGFIQFQCVIPLEYSKNGIQSLIETVSKSNTGSFLAVLKRFGSQQGKISFPLKGYTIALDFQNNDKNIKLIRQLEKLTIEHKGRFYLTKDSLMTSETLYESDPRVIKFKEFRNSQNLRSIFQSAQSTRLNL